MSKLGADGRESGTHVWVYESGLILNCITEHCVFVYV